MKKEYIEKNSLYLATLPRWVKTVSEVKEKTEKVYMHVTPERKGRVVEMLDTILS